MIGYYIHHHGRGHLTRAAAISAHLDHEVTALTSLPPPLLLPSAFSVFSHVVSLSRDDHNPRPMNTTAGGRMHWAPVHDPGLCDRMYAVADWINTHRPAALVVDVSVEVATLARLFGIPVVVVAMPGSRTDRPHDLVYGLADHIIAAWPQPLYTPHWLKPHTAKTTYVGGISRFAGREHVSAAPGAKPSVLVLSGAGGSDLTKDTVVRWAAANNDYRWQAVGVAGTPWIGDPWPYLNEAAVVISGAGQNSIADIAAARRPAVIVPQPRPFDEQDTTADVLGRNGLAVTRSTWPEPEQWPGIIEQAQSLDVDRWREWRTEGAAQRAASAIEAVADHTHAVATTS